MPSSNFSWITHVLGLERLFALRGPLDIENSSALDRAILEMCCPVMVLAAFFTQKPSIMRKSEWKATIQTYHSDELPHSIQASNTKIDLAFLIGILAKLPLLFLQCEECIRLREAKSQFPPSASAHLIWNQTRQLQQELQSWKQNWDKRCHQNKRCNKIPSSVMLDLTTTMDSIDAYAFDTNNSAITLAMYHSVVILLISIPTSLLQAGLLGRACKVSITSDTWTNNQSQPQLSDVKASVFAIHRATQHVLRSPQKTLALADFYVFFPIHIARRASIQLGLSSELAQMSELSDKMRLKYPMGVWANMNFDNRFTGLEEGLFG